MEQERLSKGIWIPIEIWKDKNLTWNEKILFLEIDSYTSQDIDCFFSNEYISELLGISQTNANKTLSSLINKGYVIKTKFDGRHRYVKSALSYSTTLPCQERQGSRVRDISVYNIIENNKTINKKENNKKKELDLSNVSEPLMPIVLDWLSYKREKKQTYTPKGFKVFYKNLCEMSGNSPVIARNIIEQSMQNNWSGIFALKNINEGNMGYPKSVDDVKPQDIQTSFVLFQNWLANKMYKVLENLKGTAENCGFPKNQSEYSYFVNHTVGGAKGLCYVVLVFNRDGWDKYYDERGFAATYANYIKANGMYRE